MVFVVAVVKMGVRGFYKIQTENMKNICLSLLIIFTGIMTSQAQYEPYGLTVDYSLFRSRAAGSQSRGFSTNNLGGYYNPKLLERKFEIGVNFVLFNSFFDDKFENHYGLRVNYLFRNKTKLTPYIGTGIYYSINSDGINVEDAERGRSFKGFAGLRYHFKDWFFLKAEMGNYRYDFEVRGVVIHPTLGLGFSL